MVSSIETTGSIVEIRPGRKIFLRKGYIGDQDVVTDGKIDTSSLQLLFVHGLCGTEKQFQLLLHSMDETFNSIHVRASYVLFDCVGCGQSPILTEWDAYKNEETMADLNVVMESHLDHALPTVIIGHSFGPSIFLRLLRQQLEHNNGKLFLNLLAFIFLGSALRFPENPQRDGGHPIFVMPTPILRCIQHKLTDSFVEMGVHSTHHELQSIVRIESNKNNMQVAKAYHRQAVWATPSDAAPFCDIPALIVHGNDDRIIPPVCAQKIALSFHQFEVRIIQTASHLLMVEQPEEVSNIILAFLQKLSPKITGNKI